VCFAVAGDNRYHAILGGKGCFAVCPSDMAIALAALEAEITVRGPAGERTIPIRDFYTIAGNSLKQSELVTEIRITPPPRGARQTFLKFRLRKALDFAIVSVAAVIKIEGGICQEARIALGAVAPTPIRAAAAERVLVGQAINAEMAEQAAQAAVAGANPLAMNAYKVEIAKALVKKALLV
jgi:xanthine dehydrogenase YagS FAD-binding subunit